MSDSTIQTAARWSARLRAEDCTEDDQRRFTAWLDEHPRHREVFSLMSGVWASSATLAHSRLRPAPSSRRAVLTVGIGLAASLFGLPSAPAEAMVLRTATGERRRCTLQGGADLLLDTQSMLILPPAGAHGQAWLPSGRIALSLANGAAPLRLATATGLLTSPAGQFDIGVFHDGLAATVLAGSLTAFPASGSAPITIGSGTRLTLRSGHPPCIDHPRLDDLVAWRTGRIVFRDTRLSEAIIEMNRYSDKKIEIASPDIAALRISGLYHTGNMAGFARALTHLLPVRIEGTTTLRIVKL
ncbi:FecR family protein [Gluconacetobacter sp. Hr-1-5]|uniref:FecR family protein n=1 Tax=Gluconacetobacter sp. Hr-1-5 TaxID=3395370 RepID=UPI003B51B7E6